MNMILVYDTLLVLNAVDRKSVGTDNSMTG
jgi:hypothetical protein